MCKLPGKWGRVSSRLLQAVPLFLLIAAVCQAADCRYAYPWGAGTTPPYTTSIVPNSLTPGNTYTVTVTGNFPGNGYGPGCDYNEDGVSDANGNLLYYIYDNNLLYPSIIATQSYLTVSNFTWPNTTTITYTITLTAAAPPGTYSIEMGCDGGTGDNCGAGGSFQIMASGPTITSVSPDGWWAGKQQDITIQGNNFLEASDPDGPTKLTAMGAKKIPLANVTVVSATEITAAVEPAKDEPAETVTLTATNPPKSSVPGSSTASPAPVVLPVPVITWRGRTISGDNARTQKVKAGQPVELSTTPATLPGGFTISQSTWNIDGTTIKSYSADDSGITVEDTDLDTMNTSFYWLYPDTGLDATYDYCATDPGGNQLCTSPQAKATFNVQRPDISLTVTDPYNQGRVNELRVCGQRQKEAWMFYGNLNYESGACMPPFSGTEGIDLTASGGDGGVYTFVQVIKSDTLSWAGDSPYQCGPSVNVLDGQYPFRGVRPPPPGNPTVAYDGPGQSLPNSYTTGTRNFDAIMYLLWKPPQLGGTGTASIPVPVGHQEWQFIATATQKLPVGSGKWNQPDTQAAGKIGDFVPSTDGDNAIYGYPMWSGISDVGSCDPENHTQEVEE